MKIIPPCCKFYFQADLSEL